MNAQAQMMERNRRIDNLVDQRQGYCNQRDRQQSASMLQRDDNQNRPQNGRGDVRKIQDIKPLQTFQNSAEDSEWETQRYRRSDHYQQPARRYYKFRLDLEYRVYEVGRDDSDGHGHGA